MNGILERTRLLDEFPSPCLHCLYMLFHKFYCFPYFKLAFIDKIIMIIVIDIHNNNWAQGKTEHGKWSGNIMISISKVPYKRIRIFFNPHLFLSGLKNVHVHTYPVNSTYESTTLLIPEGKFLTTLWIRNRVDAKSGYFVLSGDLTRSSPAVYCEYCIQDGNLDACSVANIPRGVLGTRGNPDTR